MSIKRVMKSPNTTVVVSGVIGTLSVIHPAYAGILALIMAGLAPVLPGYVKPNPPKSPISE